MHICARCEKRLVKDEPPKVICNGEGIYFFCSVVCRDKWMTPHQYLKGCFLLFQEGNRIMYCSRSH